MTVIVKDRNWQELLKRIALMGNLSVRVGILASKGGGDHEDGAAFTLAELAAVHEFGSEDGHIPERAPIRKTFYEVRKTELSQMQMHLAKAVVLGQMAPQRALGLLGVWASNAIKKTITDGEGLPPPNAPSTIAAKGSDRPLVDTGQLKAAYSYEIVDSKEGGIE